MAGSSRSVIIENRPGALNMDVLNPLRRETSLQIRKIDSLELIA